MINLAKRVSKVEELLLQAQGPTAFLAFLVSPAAAAGHERSTSHLARGSLRQTPTKYLSEYMCLAIQSINPLTFVFSPQANIRNGWFRRNGRDGRFRRRQKSERI